MNLFFNTFLSLVFLKIIYCDYPQLSLEVETTGELKEDNSTTYFSFVVPNGVKQNTSNLIIRVRQNNSTEFSDPDLYVSKTEKEPNFFNADWSCERYGEDMISVSSQYVFEKEIFYIAVYCERKCKYSIKTQLTEEIKLTEGKVYAFDIPKDSSMNFKFKTKETEYDEISFFFISPEMKPFKVYVSQNESPSSGNTYELEPSFISGYTLNIRKSEKDIYCYNCYYYIMVVSVDQPVNVRMLVEYPDTETFLYPNDPIIDNVPSFSSRCYAFNMSNQNESVIITIILFSGSGVIQFNGYKSVTNLTFLEIPYDDTSYDVTSEKVIILTPHDLLEYQKVAKEKHNITDFSKIYFCFFGYEKTSYLIRAHFQSQMQMLQRYNYLLTGTSISGYLPKGDVTSYRILEFTRDGNITLTLDLVEGTPKIYGYFEPKPFYVFFNSDKLKKAIKDNKLINSTKTLTGYEIEVLNKDNICHKSIGSETDLNDAIDNMVCRLYLIVSCDDSKIDCIYRVRAIHDESSQKMIPRTSFYNVLPKGEIDYFEFTVDDNSVNQIIIVLNTLSGDTVLRVKKKQGDSYKFIDWSDNQAFIPDVVKIIKENNDDKITGTYYIEVRATSFSTYSIYYYTVTESQDINPDVKDISLELQTGQIVYDFLPKDQYYKIYSYEIDGKSEESELRITLTRKNFPCRLYVFLNLDSFRFNQTDSYELIGGYDWKGETSGQLIIKKTDPKYSKKGPYYILVSRLYQPIGELTDKWSNSYYLGVTDEKTNFMFFENMQHMVTLNNLYSYQGYSYIHQDSSYDFTLSLNVFYGKVNIYLDFKEFNIDDINNNKTVAVSYKDINTKFISIKDTELQAKCETKLNCPIFILVTQTSDKRTGQYLLMAKSRTDQIHYLVPGTITENYINEDETQYFLIEDYSKKNKVSHLHVSFISGEVELYLSITSNTNVDVSDYPTNKTYQYKANEYSFKGKIITIDPNDVKDCYPCRYLISVYGKRIGYKDNMIIYSLYYSNEVKKINQNIPYHNIIQKGELQYFNFVFGEEAKNIYIVLQNADKNIDLFLNYGENLPTFDNFHWYSKNPFHQFINIDLNDPVIVQMGKSDLSGVYTLLLYGYGNSSYTLYITDNDKKIIPINNNLPGSCTTDKNNKICYFRYDLISNYYEELSFINDKITIVFVTTFSYGSGDMYATLYKDTEYKEISEFPDEEHFDYSNKKMTNKNFLKIDIYKNNTKLTNNSMILISVICKEDSLFDITPTILTKNPYGYQYLDIRRENIFYLDKANDSKKNGTIFYIFHRLPKDINFEFYSYIGSAKVLVYQNNTKYNSEKNEHYIDYTHIAEFDITSGSSYVNTIKNNTAELLEFIYFKVVPQTEIGFYIKINYDSEWEAMPIGEMASYPVSNNIFYGYFDMLEEYQEVILSVRAQNRKDPISVYVKMNLMERNDMKNLSNIDIPDKMNFDYSGKSNNLLSSVTVKINQISSEKRKGKYVRAAFIVKFNGFSLSDTQMIDILVTPMVDYYKKIIAEPLKLYFSSEKEIQKDRTIFDLTKTSNSDDLFVIEISACQGLFEAKVTGELTYFEDSNKEIPSTIINESGSTKILFFNNKKSKFYLNIWGKKDDLCLDSDNSSSNLCKKGDVEYLVYYFSTSRAKYRRSIVDPTLIFNKASKNRIKLVLPEIRERDYQGNKRNIDNLDYQLFVSENKEDSQYMGSLCFLNRMKKNDNITYEVNEQDDEIMISGMKSGTHYYANVIIQNRNSGELFTMKPIHIYFDKYNISTWIIVLLFVLLVLSIGVACYYFKKFRTTKSILSYAINDRREEHPRSVAELSTVKVNSKQNYANLDEEI